MTEPAIEIDLEKEAPVVEEVVHSPAETEALKHGWKPEDSWEGEAEDFISAPEFNRRAELFDKIARQSRDLKQVDSKYNQLMEMQTKIAEKAKSAAIEELMEQKAEAYAAEEFTKVVELDEKIAVEKNTVVAPVPTPEKNPEFESWAQNNEWYAADTELADLADAFGNAYGNRQKANGYVPTMEEVLAHVDSKMKPHLKPTRTTAAPAVEGASKSIGKRGPKKSGFTKKDLSPDQKEIMNDIIKTDPEFTEQMYIDSLIEIGELTK